MTEPQMIDPPPVPGWLKVCQHCRFWREGIEPEGWRQSYLATQVEHAMWGECDLTRSDGGDPLSGEFYAPDPNSKFNMKVRMPEEAASTRALALDASGYRAVLVTAPTFGCTQWSAGDKPASP